ncbi:DUF5590 domain-containing protein [Paenibacillus crassostreae]|uniref:Cell wall elongation regulator TseB-like domain-containing protein n=1 Tax=Paenibacillus crassostreae TaxID=1763538 RepID=A0A167DLM9_9BACL|nr:DUF5590 domain-containing protein [Paenibacillus crassostreae]AOZ91308.1 hypothetical protein LPB68_03220 [Paenibacillus crassostreae]OAB74534.1 hypothetical protein PNBC_10740 [Paenibacillus crassostreae]
MKKNKKKLIWLIIVIIAVLLFGLYRYYIYIMQDQWRQEEIAIVAAKQHSELIKVTRTSKSVWNDVVWVIEGQNEEDQHMIVWVPFTSDQEVNVTSGAIKSELLEDGLSRSQMMSIIQRELPDTKDIQLELGLFNGRAVWQVFYKDQDHYNYRFYRFSDGQQIGEQFTLPNR